MVFSITTWSYFNILKKLWFNPRTLQLGNIGSFTLNASNILIYIVYDGLEAGIITYQAMLTSPFIQEQACSVCFIAAVVVSRNLEFELKKIIFCQTDIYYYHVFGDSEEQDLWNKEYRRCVINQFKEENWTLYQYPHNILSKFHSFPLSF